MLEVNGRAERRFIIKQNEVDFTFLNLIEI